MTTDWAVTLIEALGPVGHLFEPGELAFLAATQKPELSIRDGLAWELHKHLGADVDVVREWPPNRHDLAILNPAGRPLMVLEAKAWITADQAVAVRADHAAKMAADTEKLASLRSSGVQCLQLVVNVQFDAAIPDRVRSFVKYSATINRAISSHGGPGAVLERSRANLTRFLERIGRVHLVEIDGGQVWGVPVRVDAYLIELALAP